MPKAFSPTRAPTTVHSRMPSRVRSGTRSGSSYSRLPTARARGNSQLRIRRVGGAAPQSQGQPLRGAGKGPRTGEDLSQGKAGQVVGPVDGLHPLPVKEVQAALRPLPCLLRALEQQEHVSPHPHGFQRQRHAAQNRRVAVVAAQMGRPALRQGQGIVIRPQDDPRQGRSVSAWAA